MLDCLIILICRLCRVASDGPFEKNDMTFLATRVLYSEATLSREPVVGIVLNTPCSTWSFLVLPKSICDHCLNILQHLSSLTETCEVVLPLNARSPDSP